MIAISDLFTSITEEQALETFLSALESLGIKARSWRKAGALRTILRVVANMYAGFSVVVVALISSLFLETSKGGWLTLLAYHVYGVTRRAASFAAGELTLTNAGAGIYSFGIGEIRALNSTTGKSYANTAAFDLNPGDSVSVAFAAREVGSASSSIPGDIDTLETFLLGVTVTNPLALIAADEESDADLRAHCKEKLAALSPFGPRDAYAYAIREAKLTSGVPTSANRWQISRASSTGIVTISIATPTGAPSSDELTAIRASVEAIARPDTVTATVSAASSVSVTRTLVVWARKSDGVDADGIAALVNAALVSMIASYPVGGIPKPPSSAGYFWADQLKATAMAAHPSIFEVDGEGADVALSFGQVAALGTTLDVRIVTL